MLLLYETCQNSETEHHNNSYQDSPCIINHCFYCIFLYFIHYYPFLKIEATLPGLGKATVAARAALPSPISACWVFLCFCNAPNCDMDYRIYNEGMWSFLCECINTGVWHTNNESAQHFWLWKTFTILCVLLTGFEPRVFGSRVQRSTNWATPSPQTLFDTFHRSTTQTACIFGFRDCSAVKIKLAVYYQHFQEAVPFQSL